MRPPLAKNQGKDVSRDRTGSRERGGGGRDRSKEEKEPSILNDDISIKFSRGIPESATNVDLFANNRAANRPSPVTVPEQK